MKDKPIILTHPINNMIQEYYPIGTTFTYQSGKTGFITSGELWNGPPKEGIEASYTYRIWNNTIVTLVGAWNNNKEYALISFSGYFAPYNGWIEKSKLQVRNLEIIRDNQMMIQL
jgi:hypothetical protein